MKHQSRSLAAALSLALTLAIAACTQTPQPPVGPTPPPTPGRSRMLAVAPSLQQTPVWCWASSAEMVFRYYNLPNVNPFGNYQCGIVAAWFGGNCMLNCALCQSTIGSMANMQRLIVDYGRFLTANGVPSRSLSALLAFRALTFDEVRTEIDAGRPIIVGIAPAGGWALPNASQHVGVLVGYDRSQGADEVIINDPYPFDASPFLPHPYLAVRGTRLGVGQFRVSYAAVVGALGWANTIYAIQ